MERSKKQNDDFFLDLMKLNTTFHWRGHIIELMGDKIEVSTLDALNELKENTSENIHSKFHLNSETG